MKPKRVVIPKAAMPVVKVLRRDVPRPEPPDESGNWYTGRYRLELACPMGLHPKSKHGTPAQSESFAGGVCSDEAVEAFADWWDDLLGEEYPAAFAAIWGERG